MPLNISELQYVIFDWDNTLAQSRDALVLAVNKVLREYNLPDWSQVRGKRDPNLSFRDNFPRIFGSENAVAAYERYVEIYSSEVRQHIDTFPGVKDVLNYFHKRGIPMMVMSNKDRRLMNVELPLLFKPELFAKVVCGHEAARDKPFPEQIYYTLEGLLKPEEITPQKVWMIGDSPMDSDAAQSANALPIRIGRSIWGDEGEPDSKIVYFNCFEEFYRVLLSL